MKGEYAKTSMMAWLKIFIVGNVFVFKGTVYINKIDKKWKKS